MPKQRVVLEDETNIALPCVQMRRFFSREHHLPGIRRLHAGDDAQQRCLAAAGRAEQGNELASRDVELDIIERNKAAKTFTDTANFYAHLLIDFLYSAFPGGNAASSISVSLRMRHSTTVLASSVTSASNASTDAAAKAPTELYSL